ncbi:GntR family transcriptional regulator [Nocardiopsis trehalosi]|uniref:GntR family transcriptional regulator n=1 Tax=Nocardiopsis trehalosi TaxID=109329 RepID=UPI000A0141D7|nr:GntR family transcriptional regulator [Nocardiopsis trehalosi]
MPLSDTPRSTRAHVAAALREAILAGELPPGARLHQDRLRHDHDVSAAPVREALRQLETEGLVVHRPNRGVFVADVSPRELRDVLLPLRLHLERYALDRAVARDRAGLCGRLAPLVDRMARAAARGDLRGVTEADVEFHRTLVAAADAPQTAQLWGSIQWRLRVQFHRLGAPEHRLDAITEEHAVLLEAIRDGDTATRHAALRAHIVDAAERLLGPDSDTVPAAGPVPSGGPAA